MSNTTIEGLIEGGKATSGPPFGPALGPLGINIQEVINKINEKTKDFEGIKISVKVIVDLISKKYEISVGLPQTSALILKELNISKGAKIKEEIVGNLNLEQIKKIALKKDLFGASLKDKVTQVLGTCRSMGVTCENKSPKEILEEINQDKIKIE